MKNNELLTLIIQTIPYPEQMKEIKFEPGNDYSIRFTWRSGSYRVTSIEELSGKIFVEEIGQGVLIGSDITIILDRLLNNAKNRRTT